LQPAAALQPGSGLSPDTFAQARDVFEEMKRQYASGNFARYGELLQELGKLLAPPQR
jgi:DNA-binding GntR family transcriptional regulator